MLDHTAYSEVDTYLDRLTKVLKEYFDWRTFHNGFTLMSCYDGGGDSALLHVSVFPKDVVAVPNRQALPVQLHVPA